MPFVKLSSEEKKGWFSAALFRKNAVRFWPLWASYGVVQFFLLDMKLIQGGPENGADRAEWMREWVMESAATAGITGLLFGLLFAMALFSYLMNSRAAGFLHSLPVRREGLFFTNFSLGACFFLLPDLLAALIAAAAGAFWGAGLFGVAAQWLVSQVVVGMLFFSFAVCCAMFTGHILALPVFYGILNFLALGLAALIDNAMDILLLGFSGSGITDSSFIHWCTPVWHVTRKLEVVRDYAEGGGSYIAQTPGLGVALGYSLVLGAVFASIALWVYHFRELERAGDVVTVGWMRPVFQYGLGFCVGLSGGEVIYGAFFSDGRRIGAFLAFAAVWAVVGAFAGRMLLKKTLRVFSDGWKGPAVLGVCMLLLLAGVRADFIGYQRWTPDPAEVEWVEIHGIHTAPWDRAGYTDMTLNDPEDIAACIDIHKAITGQLDEVWRGETSICYRKEDGYEVENEIFLRVDYLMKDGSIVRRRWNSIPISAQALEEPETYAAKLMAFVNRPSIVEKLYLRSFRTEPGSGESTEVVSGWISDVAPAGEDEPVYLEDKEIYASDASEKLELDAGQARKLWQAVQEDMAAGDLGRRYLLESRERYENCYQSDLNLTFLNWRDTEDGPQSTSWTLEITLQRSAKKTMAALEEMGYLPRLRPWDEPD